MQIYITAFDEERTIAKILTKLPVSHAQTSQVCNRDLCRFRQQPPRRLLCAPHSFPSLSAQAASSCSEPYPPSAAVLGHHCRAKTNLSRGSRGSWLAVNDLGCVGVGEVTWDEVSVLSATEVRRVAPGGYIFIFAPLSPSLHRPRPPSYVSLFAPPFPNSLLLFFLLMALLPIFIFFFVKPFSACTFDSNSLCAVWKQCNSPFQQVGRCLIFCTCITSLDTLWLFPICLVHRGPKRSPFSCYGLTPSTGHSWCCGSVWVLASLRLWYW